MTIKEGIDILNGKKIVKSYHNMYEMLKDLKKILLNFAIVNIVLVVEMD